MSEQVPLGPEYDRIGVWTEPYKEWLRSLKVGDWVLIDATHGPNRTLKVITRETATRFYYATGITEDYFRKKDGVRQGRYCGYARPYTITFKKNAERTKKIKAISGFYFADASDEFLDKMYALVAAEIVRQAGERK